MDELIIRQNNERLKQKAPMLLFVFAFFSAVSYLKAGWSNQTQIVIIIFSLILLFSYWVLHIQSKRKVVINKLKDQIHVYETKFFGSTKKTSYAISDFSYIRSFITHGKGAVNCVELVSQTGNWGLVISSFLPAGGENFFSLGTETESAKAKALCEAIADYTLLSNEGFLGHDFLKTPIESKNKSKLIKSLF